jgi:sugar transferase (PEP-CTERM/EpsH1 system associated)
MRILFVVPNVPSFIRPRPLNFIRGLSQNHEISVLCVATNESDHQFASELRPYCHRLEIIRLSRWESLWHCIVALFSSEPLRCAYFYSPSLRDRVRTIVHNKEVDLVHAEHLKSVPMVKDVLGKIPAVFDAVDCISMFEGRRRRIIRNPFLQIFSWTEWKKMKYGEAKTAQLFNRVLISSPIDKEHYSVSGQKRDKIDVIPNAVDLRHFAYQQFTPQKDLLVFCAKLDYFPNQDAIEYFTESVWPLLRVRRPELHLEIVGSRPPRSVRQLNGQDNIQVVGSVSDVRPHLGRASVALCPIRLRAGTQFKVLEAMALGVPVVATRICCPGLGVEAGKHLLVADTPEEFASAVELLLDDENLRENVVRSGRTYVEKYHGWAGCVKELSESYTRAMEHFRKSDRAPISVA